MDKFPHGASLKMSIDEKRQLLHELSKDSDSAVDAMKKWSREELLQVLCAELGEKRNTSKWSTDQIITKLLKAVSEKKDSTERDSKRQRKIVKSKGKGTVVCKNLSCQAVWRLEDWFCKRCTCCLCFKYDDNKDPSLWLTCQSESCGLSYHLECTFKTETSGLKENEPSHDTDGCFFCVYCGKTNSLLECWKKQLLMAAETTSVEVLLIRLVLAQKLLKGTEKYIKVSETVEEAVKCLETELGGPLTDRPSAMCRGLVSRLSSAPKVKDLCSSALKYLQDTPLDDHQGPALHVEIQGTKKIRFEDVDATSLTLIVSSEEETSSQGNINHYSVWHRKVSENDYAEEKTCALVSPNTSFVVFGLTPATEYCFKVVSFRGLKETSVEEIKVSTKPPQEEGEEVTASNAQLALQETVLEKGKSSSNRGFELEDCVRALRQLELSGYVDTDFRLKFLTWYGLQAGAREKYLVEVFVDIFKNHPKDLAEQLIHTFSDLISR